MDEVRPGVEGQGVPDADVLAEQGRRDAADPLLVAVGDHDDPLVVERSLTVTTSPTRS